jgi:hypothetical protein
LYDALDDPFTVIDQHPQALDADYRILVFVVSAVEAKPYLVAVPEASGFGYLV